MTDPKSEPSERALPKGEVMARGVINGLPVELIRYTEAEIRARDRQWQYDVRCERDTARSERCHRMNLELDLRRLLDGEPTICDFKIVEELRAALTPAPATAAGALTDAQCDADKFAFNAIGRAVILLRSLGDRDSSKEDPYGGLFWYDDADTLEQYLKRHC